MVEVQRLHVIDKHERVLPGVQAFLVCITNWSCSNLAEDFLQKFGENRMLTANNLDHMLKQERGVQWCALPIGVFQMLVYSFANVLA